MNLFSLDNNLESDAISRTKAARRSRNAVWGQKNKIENGVQAFPLSARQGLAGEHYGHVSGFVKKCPVQPNSVNLSLRPAIISRWLWRFFVFGHCQDFEKGTAKKPKHLTRNALSCLEWHLRLC
jgi:hypothetical protein